MGKVDKLASRTPPRLPGEPIEKIEDRRIQGERLRVSFQVVATHRGHLIQGYVEAINLSWSGMLLATNFPLDIGDRLSLDFTLPESGVPITTNARVIHKRDGTFPEEATCIGIVFENLDPNVQRMISGFVLEHLPTN
jgi:hypothetical protein